MIPIRPKMEVIMRRSEHTVRRGLVSHFFSRQTDGWLRTTAAPANVTFLAGRTGQRPFVRHSYFLFKVFNNNTIII